MADNINQLVLFCTDPDCYSPNVDDNGVCTECGKHNVLREWSVLIALTAVGYTEEEALQDLSNKLEQAPEQFLNNVIVSPR